MGRWLKRSVLVALLAVGVWFYTRPDPISKLDIHGTWNPDFKPVADVFRQLVQSGQLRGGSFAAYVDGKPAVNIWGGYADEEFGLEWTENTITGVASTTKFVSAIAFSTLIDKGLVNYDELVSKHWPEFAQNGKENVTVNMLISHQAGLFALDKVVKFGDVVENPEKMEKILAEQKPAWPPGTAIGYHTLTIGMYVDFLGRKIDPKHRPIYQIYEEDIRKPLELDFHMNTPYSEQYRRARLKMPSVWDTVRYFIQVPTNRDVTISALMNNPLFANMMKGTDKYEGDKLFVDHDIWAIPIPAAGGAGNAVSLAKLFGIVAARTPVKGRPLLSERIVQQLNTISLNGIELLMRFNASVGHGTFVFQNPWGENVFGHPGAGGQLGYSDPTNKVGLAFITNYFGPYAVNDDLRFVPLEEVFYDCLGRKKR